MMGRVVLAITLAVFAAGAPAYAALDAGALCQEAKAKAAGKKAFDLLKAFGKNIKVPKPAKLAQDISKAESKFTKGFTKAEGRGGCPTSGDSDAIEAKVDLLGCQIVESVGPATCGNNCAGVGEECDGADDAACPGRCIPAGSGGEVCGDNVRNGGVPCTCATEECDGTDDAACPGGCVGPGDFCGDNVRNGGVPCTCTIEEECDGTDNAACPGRCIPAGSGGEVCGDNVRNGGVPCTCATEECDGTDDAACPGGCVGPGDFCGDNVRNGVPCTCTIEEECDGTDDAACPGRCVGPGGSCGDNVRKCTCVPEECDGTDDAACPGRCIPAGKGGWVCGDNVRNGGLEFTCAPEECDGTDDSACPEMCQANCRCPRPGWLCGNDKLEVGEECDPPCSEGPPCGSGTICGTTCACVQKEPCSCGSTQPALLDLLREMMGGACGELNDVYGSHLGDLDCAKLYLGGSGAGAGISFIADIPLGKSINKVQCCYGTTLVLGSTTPAEVGTRHCTQGRQCSNDGSPCVMNSDCGAGTCVDLCLFGAPVPIIIKADSGIFNLCNVNSIEVNSHGYMDCSTGEGMIRYPVLTATYWTNGDDYHQPCPICNPVTLKCNGGRSNGQDCTPQNPELSGAYPTSHDCLPAGTLMVTTHQPYALKTGTTSMRADVREPDIYDLGDFCGYCRDIAGLGSKCFEGDNHAKCPSAIPPANGNSVACVSDFECQHMCSAGSDNQYRPCLTDADCPEGRCVVDTDEYESCVQRDPGAFHCAQVTKITVRGSPAGSISDGAQHDVILSGAFCLPPLFDPLVDNLVSLPGPGVLSLPGKLQLRF